jgi:hypothetical protein
VGLDDGDAGADRTDADLERTVAADEGHVADPHAGDVGDRVERPVGKLSDPDAELVRLHRRR